jgi:hypothetical protein
MQDGVVLVNSSRGVYRSPTVVTAYLMQSARCVRSQGRTHPGTKEVGYLHSLQLQEAAPSLATMRMTSLTMTTPRRRQYIAWWDQHKDMRRRAQEDRERRERGRTNHVVR